MCASRAKKDIDWQSLLDDLSRFAGGGTAETGEVRPEEEFFRNHLPVAEHWRVFERETLLVLGGRGTGKSQLFNALRRLENPHDLLASGRQHNRSASSDVYRAGYTAAETTLPRPEVLARLLSKGGNPQHIWHGLLCGILLAEKATRDVVTACLCSDVCRLFDNHLSEPSQWLDVVQDLENSETIMRAFDQADKHLTHKGTFLVITYDDLDVLAAVEKADVYPLVRELLKFWLLNSRRWRNLRCKVFLRTDIFDAEELAFTDSSKLRPLSVTLQWNADNLYRLVLKRLLNGHRGGEWQVLIGDSIRRGRLRRHSPWGIVPETDESDHRAFMKLVVGEWMGSDRRRGDTYRWFLNHLQDSRRDIAPRSFVKLFERSAARQLGASAPSTTHLLSPEQINGALAEVSRDRIEELREEYTWIDDVGRVLDNQTVPIERRELRKCIRAMTWERLPEGLQSRKDRVDRLIDYLISLGILREMDDARIHVPDIYLFGFGLKRKGGIRRPRV